MRLYYMPVVTVIGGLGFLAIGFILREVVCKLSEVNASADNAHIRCALLEKNKADRAGRKPKKMPIVPAAREFPRTKEGLDYSV